MVVVTVLVLTLGSAARAAGTPGVARMSIRMKPAPKQKMRDVNENIESSLSCCPSSLGKWERWYSLSQEAGVCLSVFIYVP
jgi:hypothetical protein